MPLNSAFIYKHQKVRKGLLSKVLLAPHSAASLALAGGLYLFLSAATARKEEPFSRKETWLSPRLGQRGLQRKRPARDAFLLSSVDVGDSRPRARCPRRRAPGPRAFGGHAAGAARSGAPPAAPLGRSAPPALTRALCGRWYRQSVWSRSKPTTSHSAREKCRCIAEPPSLRAGGGGERGGRRKERGRRFLRSRAGRAERGPQDSPGPLRPAPPGPPSPAAQPRGEPGMRGGQGRADGRRRVKALEFEKHASRRGFVRLGVGVGTERSRSSVRPQTKVIGGVCWEDLVSREQAGNGSQPWLVTGHPVTHRKGPTGDN